MNKSAMCRFVNNALNTEEMLNNISHCIAIECYLYNLAVDTADECNQRYHGAKIKGLGLAVNCMHVDIYVHHEKDMAYKKIEYFTLSQNGEILIEESDFWKAAKEFIHDCDSVS